MLPRVPAPPLLVIAAFVAALGLGAAVRWTAPVRDAEAAAGAYRPVAALDEGYTSSGSCKSCHPAQYAAWHRSYHRTMTQLASPATSRASFNGTRIAGVQDQPIVLTQRGRELWSELSDVDWSGTGDPPRVQRQIVMVTGSHQQQVFWYRTPHNRLLGQLPAMYLVDEGRWIPRRAAFLRPPPTERHSETGRWNAVCIDCHATNGERGLSATLGSQPLETIEADTTVAEFGIACEACHGPGEAHARANRSPWRRYRLHLTGADDRSIVLPTRLDARRSSQVCGQCHSTSLRYDRAGIPPPPSTPPYRPGGDLDATHFVLQPARNGESATMRTILEADPSALRDSFWPDGMIRVSGREYNGLIDSPCFANAQDPSRTLSCASCHTMHKPTSDSRSLAEWADTHQVAAGREGNEACSQCHANTAAAGAAHTRHRPESSGSLCYNCHMPYTTYGLLRSLRSHQISSPSATVGARVGRPNACNLCHLDKTLDWTADYLDRWYGLPKPALEADDATLPASMLWLLRGDAGQRALVAWTLGWTPAQQASGTAWMAPSLSVLMNDPYEAVRFIAHRSLRTLPGFGDFTFDFVAPAPQRAPQVQDVMDRWRRAGRLAEARHAPALLLDSSGVMKPDVTRLLRLRDHRRMDLRE